MNMLHDIEPRDPAPRCPHCAALEARVDAPVVRVPCRLCHGDGEVWMSGAMVPCICDNTTTALARYREQADRLRDALDEALHLLCDQGCAGELAPIYAHLEHGDLTDAVPEVVSL